MENSNEIKSFEDYGAPNEQGGQAVFGGATAAQTSQAGQVSAAQSAGADRRVGQEAGCGKIHVKHLHGPDAWAMGSGVTTDANVLGRGAEIGRLMAESLLKLQQDRDAEIRAAVARQQAGLLNQLAEEAEAPMTELEIAKAASESQQRREAQRQAKIMQPGWFAPRKQFDALAFEALERQVRWLMEQGRNHAMQLSRLHGQVSELVRRVKDLEHVIAEAFPARPTPVRPIVRCPCCQVVLDRIDEAHDCYGGGSVASDDHTKLIEQAFADAFSASAISVVGVDSGPIKISPAVDDIGANCVHDINRKDTTVSAITRKKARCNVCARVWEST